MHTMIKGILAALGLCGLAASPANALQGYSSCHGAGSTVTSVSGFDTSTAKMTSEVTLPDAMEYCHRYEQLNGAALTKCAHDNLRDPHLRVVITVWANCKKATLTVEDSSAPSQVDHYHFPMESGCGNGGTPAIDAFKTLCPNYQGKIEIELGEGDAQ